MVSYVRSPFEYCIFCRRAVELLSSEDAVRKTRHVVPRFDDLIGNSSPPATASDSTSCEESEIEETSDNLPGSSLCVPTSQSSSSFIGKTGLKHVLLDAATGEAPCVLHIHSRRPADWLMSRLGLPPSEGLYDVFSLPWYCFYSLYGCRNVRHRAGYFSALILIVLIVISALVVTLGGGAVVVTALWQQHPLDGDLRGNALNALSSVAFPRLPLTSVFTAASPAVARAPFMAEDVPLAVQLLLRFAFMACVQVDTFAGVVVFPLLQLCVSLLPLAVVLLVVCVPSLWALALAYYDLPLREDPEAADKHGAASKASNGEVNRSGKSHRGKASRRPSVSS